MRNESCAECNRLWREYASATTEHMKLESQLKLAAQRIDAGLYEQLDHATEAAVRKREAARQNMRVHESTHGPAIDAAQMGDSSQ